MVNLIRVVRMTFVPEKVAEFKANFAEASPKIRAFAGCRHLELWQDPDKPEVFMTYSHWESAEALENYRHSELFRQTWKKTKVLFAERPVAFSAVSDHIVVPQSEKSS